MKRSLFLNEGNKANIFFAPVDGWSNTRENLRWVTESSSKLIARFCSNSTPEWSEGFMVLSIKAIVQMGFPPWSSKYLRLNHSLSPIFKFFFYNSIVGRIVIFFESLIPEKALYCDNMGENDIWEISSLQYVK